MGRHPCKTLKFDVQIAPPAPRPRQCSRKKNEFSHPAPLPYEPEKVEKIKLGNFAVAAEFFSTSKGARFSGKYAWAKRDESVLASLSGPSDLLVRFVSEAEAKREAKGKREVMGNREVEERREAKGKREVKGNREVEEGREAKRQMAQQNHKGQLSFDLPLRGGSFKRQKRETRSSFEFTYHSPFFAVGSNDEFEFSTKSEDLEEMYIFGKA